MKFSLTASAPHLAMPSSPALKDTGAARRAAPAPTTAQLDAAKNPAADSSKLGATQSGAAKTAKIETGDKAPGGKSGSEHDGAKAAPKKRVRLKPETPEQLIERLRNPMLSLHEASILLRVSRATVRRYADSGRLGCQRTPGGQRRFYLRDIENFYRQLKLKR